MSNRLLVSTGIFVAVLLCASGQSKKAYAQSYGIELHNALMPASGAMGGASIARPQDVPSAINGNPASMAQFLGTQFTMSGSWAEPTFVLRHNPPPGGVIPSITDGFSSKSTAQGSVIGNIAVTHSLRELGLPITLGSGLIASSGAGASFRSVPESNGTSTLLQVLALKMGAGVELTDNIDVGATIELGTGILDGPFVALTGATYDYTLRGAVGVNWDVREDTTIGFYYQTTANLVFDDAVVFQTGPTPIISDIDLGLPDNIGIGIANESLFNGRLLLAMDVVFKQWDNAALFNSFYHNQWMFQFGAQYKVNQKIRFRMGYAYTDNIHESNPGNTAGGVTPPGAEAAIQYVGAQFPAINKHRLSGGVGIKNLIPNVDFDLLAGGMFEETHDFGEFTQVSLESYWVGAGITWRFGCANQHPL